MAIRKNTNPREMDLQPEMRDILMRNGMQAHIIPIGDGYQLAVQGHDTPPIVTGKQGVNINQLDEKERVVS